MFCGSARGAPRSSGAPVHWTAWTPGIYATGLYLCLFDHICSGRDFSLWTFDLEIYSVHICTKMHQNCKFGEISPNSDRVLKETRTEDQWPVQKWVSVMNTTMYQKCLVARILGQASIEPTVEV